MWKPVKQNQQGIQCDGCDLWCHRKCVSMPIFEYKNISSNQEPWLCPPCHVPPELNDNSSTTNTDTSTHKITRPNHKGITFAHLNCNSFLAHIDEIKTAFNLIPYDILCFSESKIDNSILDGELSLYLDTTWLHVRIAIDMAEEFCVLSMISFKQKTSKIYSMMIWNVYGLR